MKFTAIYVNGNDGWIVALVEEFGSIVVQGKTIEQARERVISAMTILMEEYREVVYEGIEGRHVLAREPLRVEDLTFTAVYVDGEDGWVVVVVEQYPEITTQGRTIAEAREYAIDAVQIMLAANRLDCAEGFADRPCILLREVLTTNDDRADA